MYPKVEEGAQPLATGIPMSGGGGYYQAGGATAAFAVHHLLRHQRRPVHAAHRLPVRLLLLLPRQDARAVRPPGDPLRRLLRVLRALPGVPRAQEARLRHEHRMACEHGEAGPHRRHHAAADAPWDDPLIMLPLAYIGPCQTSSIQSPWDHPSFDCTPM